MVQHYLLHHAPTSGDMNRYGETFPNFIAHYEGAQSLPYLPALARYEWAWLSALLAPNDVPLDPAMLMAAAQAGQLERAVIQPRKSVQIMQAYYPVDRLWHFCEVNKGEGTPPDMTRAPLHFLLWREQGEVMTQRINQAQYALWNALLEAQPLQKALEEAMQHSSDFDTEAFIAQAVSQSLWAGVRAPDDGKAISSAFT